MWIAAATLFIATGSHSQALSQGGEFDRFLGIVVSVDASRREPLVDSLLLAVQEWPLIERDRLATFIYRGEADTVSVAGDFTRWEPDDFLLTRIPGTDLWHRSAVFEPDARLEYKIVVDGVDWILDPLNQRRAYGPLGTNSELAMPAYEVPEEVVPRQGVPHGSQQHFDVASEILGNTREIVVYLPPSYEAGSDSFAVALFHDGSDWLEFASVVVTLDNLIDDGRIAPLIAVFVSPIDRFAEQGYTSTGDDYARFVTSELMPEVDRRYRTRRDPRFRGTVGVSLGGVIATQIAYQNPDVFGLVGAISPAYWVRDRAIVDELSTGWTQPIRFYTDAGSYELLVDASQAEMVRVLKAKGYEVESNLWHEAHNWGNWRAHLDKALEYLYPPN